MSDAIELLKLGGPLMLVILAGSLVALAIFIERLIALRRNQVVPATLRTEVPRLVAAGDIDKAREACEGTDSSLARVLLAGLVRPDRPLAELREAISDKGRRETVELERFTGLLGSIATTMPLVGLLGTVTGMIKTFQAVQATIGTQAMNAGMLANGIWEALLTTAAGLCVAIPAFVAHRYLSGRIDRLVVELEEVALEVAESLSRTSES